MRAVRLARERGAADRRALRRAQLGGQPRARRRDAARRLAAERRDDRRRRDDRDASSPGCRGNELLAAARRARPLLPRRALPRRRPRRLPAAGRLRLERARARPGLHERRGDRRRHRRRRAGARRRDAEHADLLWAARGSGPGFFGAVTRFHLRLHPRPRSSPTASTSTRSRCSTRSSRWAHEIGPHVPRDDGADARHPSRRARASSEIAVTGPVLVDSPRSEAREALALLETCPVLDRAKARAALRARRSSTTSTPRSTPPTRTTTATPPTTCGRTRRSTICCRACARIARDAAAGAVAHALDELGPGASPRRGPDMAYSVEDDTYIALYGVWARRGGRRGERRVGDRPDARDGAPRDAGSSSPTRTSAERPARFTDRREHGAARRAARARTTRTACFHAWMGRL